MATMVGHETGDNRSSVGVSTCVTGFICVTGDYRSTVGVRCCFLIRPDREINMDGRAQVFSQVRTEKYGGEEDENEKIGASHRDARERLR